MSNFEKALAFALKWEGGYSNHPADKGGATNKGVTQSTYDTYRRLKRLTPRSVVYLTDDELKAIYLQLYWQPARCDLLPEKLAICHFDWAVNAGVFRAKKTLQTVVGAVADGIIGQNTENAIKAALQANSEAELCKRYCLNRENSYRAWGKGSQAVFLQGWLNRLQSLRKTIS